MTNSSISYQVSIMFSSRRKLPAVTVSKLGCGIIYLSNKQTPGPDLCRGTSKRLLKFPSSCAFQSLLRFFIIKIKMSWARESASCLQLLSQESGLVLIPHLLLRQVFPNVLLCGVCADQLYSSSPAFRAGFC